MYASPDNIRKSFSRLNKMAELKYTALKTKPIGNTEKKGNKLKDNPFAICDAGKRTKFIKNTFYFDSGFSSVKFDRALTL